MARMATSSRYCGCTIRIFRRGGKRTTNSGRRGTRPMTRREKSSQRSATLPNTYNRPDSDGSDTKKIGGRMRRSHLPPFKIVKTKVNWNRQSCRGPTWPVPHRPSPNRGRLDRKKRTPWVSREPGNPGVLIDALNPRHSRGQEKQTEKYIHTYIHGKAGGGGLRSCERQLHAGDGQKKRRRISSKDLFSVCFFCFFSKDV